jgi:hypothetical protein
MSKKLLGGLGKVGKILLANDDAGALNAIRAAGRTAHEQEAAARAAKNAQVAEQMANLPARNKKANEALGLYHPVGGGIKLSKPVTGMHATTVADPKFNPPDIGTITPEQLVKEEAALFPLVGDRAAGGRYLTHVGENELETPVRLTAGPRYMDANYNHLDPEESAAWESGLGRVTALGRQAERAGVDGRPVYGIYTAGSGTNTDFNIMGANALLQQLPYSKITKKSAQEFDRAMREGTKEFPAIPDWPGILSPDAQLMLLDKSNGIARTKLFGTMGKENFQSMGFPDVPATRKAIIEPELLDVPTNQAGFRLARMDTTGRIIEQPNIPSDYPVAMAGKVAGKLDVPADYKDIFQTHFDRRRLLSQPESGDYYSFSRAHPIQYADDEWLNRLMEQRRIADLKIKEGEYKKGGAVDIKAADERLAAAIEKRMAKGGAVDIEAADARLQAAIDARLGMADGGGAFKKLEFMADGGKLIKGAKKAIDLLTKLPAGTDDSQKAVAAEMAAKKAAQEAAYAPHTLPTEQGNKTIANAKKTLNPQDEARLEAELRAKGKATAPAVPRRVSAGDIVNGMLVRKDIPNTSSIGASLTDYSTHGLQEVPMSAFETVGKPRYRNAQERERTQELARQIQQNKELNPLIVVKDAEGHYILEGGHRFDALRELGIDSFPALMVHDLESLGDIAKAHGGIAMAKGGKFGNLLEGAKKVGKVLMAPQDEALKLAQERAALPPSKGGLGLPANNTPQQRAEAMGFTTDAYHGTTMDFDKFIGRHPTYAAEEPRIADIYANATGRHMALTKPINASPNIIPLKLGGKELSVSDLGEGGGGWYADNLAKELGIPRARGAVNELPNYGIDRLKVTDMYDIGGIQTQHMIPSGSDNIRSRFAAFDPFRKNAAIAAAMGVAAPDLLAKEKDKKKAEGGGAFKTIQWKDAQHFDGGGIAVDLSEPSEDARREPVLTEKDWSNIKRNAPKLYKLAKEQAAQEASQLTTAGGARDFALRTGAQYLGGIPDLINLGLMGVDAGLDTNLSSERPWLGSERYLDALKSSGAIGENEFPLAEITAGILAPAGLIKKGMKKMRKLPSLKEEPKKRLGGLTALSR